MRVLRTSTYYAPDDPLVPITKDFLPVRADEPHDLSRSMLSGHVP